MSNISNIPLVDVKQQNEELREELQDAFSRVLSSGAYVLGNEVTTFEAEIAQYTQSQHAIGVSSGTDALLLSLMALGIQAGDEVICPTFTFFATAGVISRLGAVPVFCDIYPCCYNISVDDIEHKITEKTKAIIAVHLFGQSANMDEINRIAKQHNIYVIEDAAQALGCRYKGRAVGSLGDCGIFSFYPTKNLGTMGDSGMIVTNNEEFADKARILRVHGASQQYFHEEVGGNFRIDAIHAAILRVKLRHIERYHSARQINAKAIHESLRQYDNVHWSTTYYRSTNRTDSILLDDQQGFLLPSTLPGNKHIYNQFTIRVKGKGQRDSLRRLLSQNNIASAIYYPLCLHLQPCFRTNSTGGDNIKNAIAASEEVLSLPVYPEMTFEQMHHMIDILESFLKT